MRHFLPLAIVASVASVASVALPQTSIAKPACTDASRACLESVARAYIDGLVAHGGAKVPLAATVRRTENALTNARGASEVRESFVRTDMIERARDIRLFVDVAKGDVVAYFALDIDLKDHNGGGSGTTRAGNTEYEVAVTKPAGTYTVHEAERFHIRRGLIHEIEIIAHVEDGKGKGTGWPVERPTPSKPVPAK